MPISLWQRPSSSYHRSVSPFPAIAELGPRLAMMLQELAPEYAGNSAQRDERICGFTNGIYSWLFWGGVFEVPRIWFTSWPLFFLIFLQLLLTLLFLLLYFYSTSSSIVAVLIAVAGHVWVSWPEGVSIVYLIVNIATGLLLLGNRLAYAQSQLTSTKEPRSALTPQTRPPVTFLIWQ